MRSGLLFQRGIRRGFRSFLRDPGTGTAVVALAGMLFLANVIVILCIAALSAEQVLRDRTDLRVPLASAASESRVQEFFAAVRSLPSVEKAVYVTREQAYESERIRDPELVSFIERYKLQNPFPDTVAVTLASLERYEPFLKFLRTPQWGDVVDLSTLTSLTGQEQQMLSLVTIVRSLQMFFMGLLVIAFFVTVGMLTASVRNRALRRRSELQTELLAGADAGMVFLPFLAEAAFALLAAFIICITLLFALSASLPVLLPALSSGAFASVRERFLEILMLRGWVLLPVEVLTLAFAALIGVRWGLPSFRRLLPGAFLAG